MARAVKTLCKLLTPERWDDYCAVMGPRSSGAISESRPMIKLLFRRAIDACPIETGGEANPASIYHGVAAMFEKAGFAEIARRRDNRPLMRLDLAS